ncbi:MAG: heterodisulfide reductase-related iron-sulfur binding cluster [Candidatus Latescibacterota bacterium]
MSELQPVSYRPTDGLSYDPEEPKYWDEALLRKELTRAFEVCHGCRMCFKYCDAFPRLFALVDGKGEGSVRRLDAEDADHVLDACFQCKLCEVQCPYTPREGHEFHLDFPRLVHRYRAVKARKRGIPLRDRILGDPDATARLARVSLGLADAANRVGLFRWLLQRVLGVHRAKDLPGFARVPFARWAARTGRLLERPAAGEAPEAVLFQTCFVEHNEPQIGIDALEVLERNQVRAVCVRGLRCCGMPAWEHGDLEGLRRQAAANLELLLPFVERGAKVLVLNPTCAMMMRREHPELLGGAHREGARRLAAAVMDPSEFLWSIRGEPRFNTAFRSTPGAALAYHAPCHLRAQATGFKSRDLLRRIPGVQPKTVMECCGHNGTYALKVEGFEASRRIGQKAFAAMQDAGAQVWATDCPLAALQFAQHAGMRPLHPMTVLARAYREDGFPTRVAAPGAPGEGEAR